MECRDVNSRYRYYYKYSKDSKVMAEDVNILKYLMSSNLIENNRNDLLTQLLNFINTGLRFLYKYIDRLKNFKNYLKYNR